MHNILHLTVGLYISIRYTELKFRIFRLKTNAKFTVNDLFMSKFLDQLHIFISVIPVILQCHSLNKRKFPY